MMPQSTLTKKPVVIKQPVKPKVTEEQSRNIINNLFEQLDNKDADELEDIHASTALIEELNKPLAFNKEEQLYNKYNVALAAEPTPSKQEVGSSHNTVNPFSKKRKFEEIEASAKQAEAVPQSANTSYFDAKSHQEQPSEYHSALDDSKMVVDTAPQQIVTLMSSRQSEAADDWQKIKGQ